MTRVSFTRVIAFKVHDRPPSPPHDHAGFGSYPGNRDRLEVFTACRLDKTFGIPWIDHDGHPLLRLRYGQLGPVQSFIFPGNRVQVDVQAIGQLTDGDRYAACTEIIAPADQPGYRGIAEQALDLALGDRVAFLHLGPAGGQ